MAEAVSRVRDYAPADLAEADQLTVRARGGGGNDDVVSVFEEGAPGAVGQVQRLGAVPGQFQEAAELSPFRAADRARGVQVPGAQRRAAAGEVGEHLRRGPVHG